MSIKEMGFKGGVPSSERCKKRKKTLERTAVGQKVGGKIRGGGCKNI